MRNLKPSTWIFLLVGGFILWLASRGRLSKVVYAMEHGGSGKGVQPATGGTAGTGNTAVLPPTPGDPGTLFGFHPSWENLKQTGWLSSDKSLMPEVTNEVNLGTGNNPVKFTLPAGSGGWTLESESSDMSNGWGGYELWRQDTGPSDSPHAELGFLHLTADTGTGPGTHATGGQQVGTSGWPTKPEYAVGGITGPANAHLAVMLNSAAETEFTL